MEQFIVDVLKTFGFPVLCAIISAWGLWLMVRDRIAILEGIVSSQGRKIDELQEDRLTRTQRFADALQSSNEQMASAIREQARLSRDYHAILREQHQVMRDLIESIRSQGRKKHPSSDDLPEIPTQRNDQTDLFPHQALRTPQ
jgi:hypothetical protein